MSSPVNNLLAANGSVVPRTLGGASNQSAQNSNSTSTSGFSGGVSRFLESRTKNFGPIFQPVKNSRFEVAKTNPQIGLAMKFGDNNTFAQRLGSVTHADADEVIERKGGFTLSGTGVMFLKSRRQIETSLSQASNMVTNAQANSNSILVDGLIGTPPGVKGILRDSSLTDMRRRFEREDCIENSGNATEDKKSVRFNLEETKLRGSPEDDGSSSRRLTQSPEASINSDEDADDDDPWDFDDEEDDGVVGVGTLATEIGSQRGLNPFLINDDKHVKEIKVITVPKSQTIQMLKAQSFSMDLQEPKRSKLSELVRSHSVEDGGAQPVSAVTYLDKLKDSSVVKPLYEDTDSDSKGSSVRSFIINKSESEHQSTAPLSNNPFDLDELGRKHSQDVAQLEMKLQTTGSDKPGLRSLKVATKLVGFLKKDSERVEVKKPELQTNHENNERIGDMKKQKLERNKQDIFKEERENMEEQLQNEIDNIKRDHEQKLKNIRHEYELRLASHQHQLDEAMDLQLDEYRAQLEEDLDLKRKAIVDTHKTQMTTLQKNHTEILQDLERDLKSAEEIVKKEHATKLAEMRNNVTHEVEQERQRMRESGDDRLYEKVRCEKRLLEDKYRCLKEKYIRLKTDVKLSLERRNRRREAQALHQQSLHTTTTGSETERSISNKPSIGNSEIRSLTQSISCQDHGTSMETGSTATTGKAVKPPIPPKTHIAAASKELPRIRDRSAERTQGQTSRRPGIASKYIKHLQVQDDTTSVSQSDTTISNNYSKGRYLIPPGVTSDNGNSDSEAYNQENNNNANVNAQRKKLFSRLKSASTSRLNSDNYKHDRPCTPVENLRHQLQKLEDLEDQFPDNTLDTTYHLRYPFSDISNEHAGGSSELEFFKHRIHLERDSVRRAKESLRTQRTNFRARQREIKQRHKATVTRHSLDQLIQEEKELTEMEVNLHRTRALLGEKVIRLRHLEQSLLRIYEKEKPALDLQGIEQKDDATLSDLSSHSSSGFSSTDFASGADTQNLNKRKDIYHQESSECIQNLEILNAEIRDILEILGKHQHPSGLSVPMISPTELNWSHMLSPSNMVNASTSNAHHLPHCSQIGGTVNVAPMHAPQSIPTLADRLETYRQLASGRMQSSMGGAILAANTIVSQSPRAVNYTTSLVERTRDLRNWLRQAKNEHDILTGLAVPHGLNLSGGTLGLSTGVLGSATVANTGAGTSGTQTNL